MAKEQGGSMLDLLKNRIKKSGQSKEGQFYLKADSKKRVRFLTDLEEATVVTMHDKWGEVNTPCLTHFGMECPYCERDDVRTKEQFIWSVYCYDDKKVQMFMFKAAQNSPVPHLINLYETIGTIMDRDIVVSRVGEKLETQYSIVSMDKSKFKGASKIKPFTEKQVFALLKVIFEVDEEDDDFEDEEEKPKKSKKSKKAPKVSKLEELMDSLDELDVDEMEELADEEDIDLDEYIDDDDREKPKKLRKALKTALVEKYEEDEDDDDE